MEYRIATPEEVQILKPIFDEYDSPLPDPMFSKVAVAVDDSGCVKGFLVLQLVYHIEPLYVNEESRGEVNFFKLQDVLESLFTENSTHPWPYAFTSEERMDAVMERAGYSELPYNKVWRKVIQ